MNLSHARFASIDALRGLAAVLVMWTHTAAAFHERLGDGLPALSFLHTLPPLLGLGRIGVIVFFCVSGFVLCPSTEQGVRAFSINRIVRLFPAYWLSLGLALVTVWWMQGRAIGGPLVLANLSMVPEIFGQDFVIGLYWTLEVELSFYVLVLVLAQTRRLSDPWLLMGLVVFLGLAHGAMSLVRLDSVAGHAEYPFWRKLPQLWSVMFYGGYLRVLHDRGKSTAEKWKYLAALGPVIIALPLFPGLFHWATTGLYPGTTSSFATLLGVLLFYFFVFCRPLRSRFLVWLGTISYSVYLFHVVVFCAFYPALQRFPSLPLALPLVLAFALTLGLSHMVYFGIEKPCIEWGRTVSARFRRSLPSAV